MRILSLLLMVLVFGYCLALVLQNNTMTHVDLLFAQVPTMPLGVLLIITMALGVLLGLLVGVQVFKVFQKTWEINRLRKELDLVRSKHIKAVEAAANAKAIAPLPPNINQSTTQ